MHFLRATLFFLLLAASWLAGGAEGTRNRLLDGKDPLGSPGELAWQAWLLMDSPAANGGGSGGSASAWESMDARRITPKSIFFTTSGSGSSSKCSGDTLPDSKGDCLTRVSVSEDVKMSIMLQRLHAIHAILLAGRGGESSGSSSASDAGPFKIPLRVPPATSAPASSTTSTSEPSSSSTSSTTTKETTTVVTPSSTVTPPPVPVSSPAPPMDPASQGNSGDEPVEVSVVMADLTKRNSGEEEPKSQENGESKPSIKPGTDKKIPVSNPTSSPSTEETLQTTVSSVEKNDKKSSAVEGSLNSYDVAPAVVEGVLPMLMVNSNPTHVSTTPPPVDDIVLEDAEGSGASMSPVEQPNKVQDSVQLDEMGTLDSDLATSTEQTDDNGTTMKENDDERETGSADVMEHIEVVPISENSRHNLPILSDDQDTSFSQGPLTGVMHPVPLEIIRNTQSKDDVPYNNPIRFPSDSSSDPHTVHLFKGNYIKFPTEQVYRYKNKPVTDQLPEVKQSFWWLPSGWRADHQRHQPTLQDFWSRMPLSEDQPLHRRYNPIYHAPLPYQQRQAQYDPEWASMKRQMSS